MTRKPWTPDNCPVQAGMCIHDVRANVDLLVTKRYLDWNGDKDEHKPLLQLTNAGTFSGNDLFEQPFTYYPEWPCTLEEKPCCNEVEDEPLYPVLVGAIHDALVKAHYAKEGLHYYEEDGVRIWEDDLCTEINNAAEDLAKIFKEFKHDEQ